jgi:hypothetical protein
MPVLFFASTQVYAIGHHFAPLLAPSAGHLRRCQDANWAAMEAEIERRRRPGEQPRATAYYATETVEECAVYIQYRPQEFDAHGQPIPVPAFYYYRVEMPHPTRCAMVLLDRALHHLSNPAVLDQIAEEYWRQPRHRWSFYEYLDSEMTVLDVEPAPDEMDLHIVFDGYVDDRNQAIGLWPDP